MMIGNRLVFLLFFITLFLAPKTYSQSDLDFDAIDSVIYRNQTNRYSWCKNQLDILKDKNKDFPKISQVIYAKSAEFMASRNLDVLAEMEMRKALAICDNGKCYPEKGIVNIINAEYYFDHDKIVKALEIILQNNLQLEEHAPYSTVLSDSYFQTVRYYNSLESFEKAKVFLKKTIEHSKKINYKINLSRIFNQYGIILRKQRIPIEALKYFRLSIKNDKLNKNFNLHSLTYNNMASVYIDLKNYDSAYFCLKTSLKYVSKGYVPYTDLNSLEASINKRMALVFERKTMIDSALYYGKKSLGYYSSNSYFLNDQESLYRILSECYEKKMMLDSALYYQKLELKEFKSVRFLEKKDLVDRTTEQARIKHQSEDIKLLNDKNQLEQEVFQSERIIVFVIMLLIGLILYGFYRKNIVRQQQTALQLEQKVLRSQMNPHFIFNALVAIQNSMMDSDILVSASHVAKFAKLIRQNFDFTQKEYITLEEDLGALKNYISVQKMRFGESFDCFIEYENVEIETILVPPLMLQPFVENAIEIGFKGIEELGILKIKIFNISEKRIGFCISDNGVGYKVVEDDKLHSTEVFRARLFLHNSQDLKSFTVVSRPDFEGTKIEFKYTIKYV
ncbi:histidine kinase [Flavobacterium sp. Fl-318]|uniref:Histidine kinase n=1 Tax=Flavobacterium cupriresistens TaxID=2893885 RepID=A0ABU4RJY4_9FLAO|nr:MULTISPECIES: histidine kinase [unclassified Flavobacterium]MDX6191715.1 histidine kinase [Flavobacterium sp. Fl-318]UFH41659.1 histidine kinase [Flavobacterium sp. F-323]